jgi:hypothetical protein
MHDVDPNLEHALRASEPAIVDSGFSENVLRQLPAKRRSRARARRWTLGGAAGLGSLLTMLLAEPVEKMLASLVIVPTPVITIIALILIVGASLAWIVRSE